MGLRNLQFFIQCIGSLAVLLPLKTFAVFFKGSIFNITPKELNISQITKF